MTNQELEIKLDKLVHRLDNLEVDFREYERVYTVYLKRKRLVNSIIDRIYCYLTHRKYNVNVSKERALNNVNKKLHRLFMKENN